MSFVKEIEKETNKSVFTENGALSYESTLDSVLDFFSKSGALRNKQKEIVNYFMKAYAQDKTLADKALFYSRDIREGQGERANFKHILKWLADTYSEEFKPNLKLIPEFGRWDDLYALVDTPLEKDAFDVIKQQFDEDIKLLEEDKPVSLLGKWLKSENTSSKKSKELGKLTRKYLSLNSKDYRQTLSKLRTKIEIVEKMMSSGNWDQINYEHVPSKAMKGYMKAFKKHDEMRYNEYIQRVKKGEAKINTGALYPYDLVKPVFDAINKNETLENLAELDEMWKHLPNYFEGSTAQNVMCVVDVSGSMTWDCGNVKSNILPIHVAISLGLYMAERNQGLFNNYFMTFSSNPKMVKVQGNNLYEKVKFMSKSNWGDTTDLLKTFKLILDVGMQNGLKDEEMPKKLFIISDMQFDEATNSKNDKTTFERIDQMYKDAGYTRPDLIFWNVRASSDNPVTKDEIGTYLISGMSANILKHALNTKTLTALDLMLEVLNSERYKDVV